MARKATGLDQSQSCVTSNWNTSEKDVGVKSKTGGVRHRPRAYDATKGFPGRLPRALDVVGFQSSINIGVRHLNKVLILGVTHLDSN